MKKWNNTLKILYHCKGSPLKQNELSHASGKIQTNCEIIIRSFKECEITTVVNCSKDDINQHKHKT